jgi:hypothetical protein
MRNGSQQQSDEWRGKGEIAQLDRRVVEQQAEQHQADRRGGRRHGEQRPDGRRRDMAPTPDHQREQRCQENTQTDGDGGSGETINVERQSAEQICRPVSCESRRG